MHCFSRGFGFITFKDANSVENVLAKDVHMLDEKQVCEEMTVKRLFDTLDKKYLHYEISVPRRLLYLCNKIHLYSLEKDRRTCV